MPGVLLDEQPESLAGCIKWLPKKEEVKIVDASLDDGCFNHPVVILSSRAHNGKVEVFMITSFNGTDLQAKWSEGWVRQQYLPIQPSPPHPDNSIRLDLKGSRQLRKASYVNTRERRLISLVALDRFSDHEMDYYLTDESYAVLVKHAHFIEPPPPESSSSGPSYVDQLSSLLSEDRDVIGLEGGREFREEEELEDQARRQARAAARAQARAEARDVARQFARAESRASARAAQARAHASQAQSDYTYQYNSTPTAGRSERQPLLPRHVREEYRPRGRRYDPVLPTSYPINGSYGSGGGLSKPFDWELFWECVKIVFCTIAVLAVAYGVYLGGIWTVGICGKAWEWVKHGVGSIGQKTQDLWLAFLRKVGMSA